MAEQLLANRAPNHFCEKRWNGVADLAVHCAVVSNYEDVIRKCLQTR
jgi:hypothetical protein